jgi:glycosyltransferase involved in cell wall biosynthesis
MAPQARPLRALLLSHSARLGGAELSLLHLARALAAREDFAVRVLLPGPGPVSGLLRQAEVPVLHEPFGLSLDWSPRQRLRRAPREVARLAARIAAEAPDVCFLGSGGLHPALLAALLAAPSSVVLEVNAQFSPAFARHFADHRREEEMLYPHCPAIHASSEWLADWLVAERGVARERVAVIPNLTTSGGDARAAPPPPATPPHFQMLCSLEENKGVELFVQAAARLRALAPGREATFQVNGSGPRRHAARLRRQVARAGLADRFRIAPPALDTAPLYRGARAVLVLSRVEGLPRVALEAAWHGVPVIATRSRGAEEIVGPGRTGLLLEGRDPDEVARAMLRLLEDEALARRLGSEAQALHARRFATPLLLPRYLELFRAVADGKYPPPAPGRETARAALAYWTDLGARARAAPALAARLSRVLRRRA